MQISRDYELTCLIFLFICIPVLLILAMRTGVSQYVTIPGLNIILPHWIHHGESYLWGNLKGFILTFPVLMLVVSRTRSLLPTIVGILILWPIFSFVSQSLIGVFSLGNWGFSGYLYVFYGVIIYFILIGTSNCINNQHLKILSIIIIILISGIPLIFTPAILHISTHIHYIGTLVHLLGFIFGMLIPAVVQYPNLQSNRYWMYGWIVVILEWYQFVRIIPFI